MAIVLTAALLSFPVSTGLVKAETTTDTAVSTSVVVEAPEATTTPSDTEPVTEENAMDDQEATVDEDAAADEEVVADEEEAVNDEEDLTVIDESGEAVEAGTSSDSMFAWLDELIEKIQVALTFDPVEKAELIADQAVEDLAEAVEVAAEETDEATAVEENAEEIEKALTTYNVKLERALAFLETVEDPESEEAQKLQLALTKVNANNVVVLGSLLDKLPAQAAEKVALNIVRSMEKALAKAEKMEAKQALSDTTLPEDEVAAPEAEDEAISAEATESTESTEGVVEESEVEKALGKFRTALGLKKHGNAYGYYKNLANAEVSEDVATDEVIVEADAQVVAEQEGQTVQSKEVKKAEPANGKAKANKPEKAEKERNEKAVNAQQKEGKNN